MTASRLLRLYPREWQERYGEEFLATVGDEPLRFQQIIDIVSGAIDAWLSPEVRHLTRASTTQGAVTMNRTLRAVCHGGSLRMTTRDGWIGAGIMIVTSIVLALLASLAKRSGAPVLHDFLAAFAFPASMLMSMPFTVLKGQPWKAQVLLCSMMLIILVVLCYGSAILSAKL